MTQSLLKTDRRMQSVSWEAVAKYSRFNYLDLEACPHNTWGYFVVEEFVIMLAQLSIINTTIRSPNGLATVGHEYFYEYLHEVVVLKNLDSLYLTLMMQAVFLVVAAKFVIVWLLAQQNKKNVPPNQTSKSFVHRYAWLSFLTLTVGLLPIAELCIVSVKKNWWANIFQSAFVLLSVPFDLLLHTTLTFDFKFSRTNILQGRNYSYFRIRVLGMWLLGFFGLLVRGYDLRWFENILNFLHVFLASLQMSHKSSLDIYQEFPGMSKVTTITNAFYAWEAFAMTVEHAVPAAIHLFDFDLVTIVVVPVFTWLAINLSEIKKRSALYLTPDQLKVSADKATYFFEVMIRCYNNQKDDSNMLQLYTSVITHSRNCNNPMCLCFLLRFSHSLNSQDLQGSGLSRVVSKHIMEENQKKNHNLVLLNDSTLIEQIRKEHYRSISAKHDPRLDTIQLTRDAIDPNQKEYDISLENRNSFLLFVGSVFNTMIVTFEGSNFFEIALANLRFMIHEYLNSLSALIFTYDYIYSKRYASESSINRDIYLFNCIDICKRQFVLEQELKYKSYLPKLDIGQVMDYRLRVDALKEQVDMIIREKVDLYSMMVKSRIDYKGMVGKSSFIFSSTEAVAAEINTLFGCKGSNSKLIKLAARFELLVQEKKRFSHKLRTYYMETLFDMKNKNGSIQSAVNKFKFNTLNSANSVVFCRNHNGSFKIVDHSQNALHLFGVEPNKPLLKGKCVNEFMTANIAAEHDRVMINYLNGHFNPKTRGKINSVLIGADGSCVSIMIIPKLECLLTEEVFIGALLSPRKKNSLPLLCTDEAGLIIGTNKRASSFLAAGAKVSESSLFLMFPRLLQVYYPNANSRSADLVVSPVDALEEHRIQDNRSESSSNLFVGVDLVSKKTVLDMYLFQMLAGAKLKISRRKANEGDSVKESHQSNRKRGLRADSQKESEHSAMLIDKTLEALVSAFRSQATHIGANIGGIYKARATVESYIYTDRLKLVEVSLESTAVSDSTSSNFFRQSLRFSSESLYDHLSIQPDTIESLQYLCNYTQMIANLMNRVEKPISIIRKILSRKFNLEEAPAHAPKKVLGSAGEVADRHPNFLAVLGPAEAYETTNNTEASIVISPPQDQSGNSIAKVLGFKVKIQDIVEELLQVYPPKMLESLIEFSIDCFLLALEKPKARGEARMVSLVSEEAGQKSCVTSSRIENSAQMPDTTSNNNQFEASKGAGKNNTKEFIIQHSTLLVSSSSKHTYGDQRMTIIRANIKAKAGGPKFVKFERVMLVLSLLVALAKIGIEIHYHFLLQNLYTQADLTRRISEMAVPSGFMFKESVKCLADIKFEIDAQKFFSKKLFFDSHLRHSMATSLKSRKEEIFFHQLETNKYLDFSLDTYTLTASVFSLGVQQFAEFKKLFTSLQGKPQLTGTGAAPLLAQTCELSQYLARKYHTELERMLQTQIEGRAAAVADLEAHSGFDLALCVLSAANLLLFIMFIAKSLQNQIKQEASLLLFVGKDKFEAALKRIENAQDKLVDIEETDRKEEKAMWMPTGMASLVANEKSPLYNPQLTKKGRTDLTATNWKKQATIFKSKAAFQASQKNLHSTNSFVNHSQANFLTSAIWILFLVGIISVPQLANILQEVTRLSRAEKEIGSLEKMNLVVGTASMLTGVMFDLRVLGPEVDSSELRALQQKYAHNLENSKLDVESGLTQRLAEAQVCQLVVQQEYFEAEMQLCEESFFEGKQMSVFKALREFSALLVSQIRSFELQAPSAQASKAFFESQDFARADLMSDYLTVGLGALVRGYQFDLDAASVHNQGAAAFTFLILEVLFLAMFLVVYRFWWIPRNLKRWSEVRSAFLSMNDEILNDTYIKSYFN